MTMLLCENLGWESFPFNHCTIEVDNSDEFNEFMLYLETNYDFRWYSGRDLPTRRRFSDGSYSKISFDDGLLSRNYLNHKLYRYSDIINDIPFMGKRRKIVNLEDDPFGEENYGFIQNESVKDFPLNNCNITFENEQEYQFMMEILEHYGFRWLSGTSPTKKDFHWRLHKINLNGSTISLDYGYKTYKFNDILGQIKKDKILNPEDDPFGEEDYGHVPLVEDDYIKYLKNRIKNHSL